jgi:type II secretory pathway component GspD/PulD (secretin)
VRTLSTPTLLAVEGEESEVIIGDRRGDLVTTTINQVTTSMIVPDGRTVFVGGLIKHRIDESKRGVPVLGRIPVVGRLFSNRQKTNTNTETIVLITPTIVAPATPMIDKRSLDKIEDIERDQIEEKEKLDDEMEQFFGGGIASAL